MEPQRRSAEPGRIAQAGTPSFAAVCSELLASLGRAVRLTALYRATHPMAADAIRDAFNLLDMAYVTGRRDRIAISLVEGRWFCEETLVQAGTQSAEPLRRMFKAQNLRSLSFTKGLRPAELATLCEAVSASSGPGESGALGGFLAQKGITHIELALASYTPTATQALPAPVPGIRPGSAAPERPSLVAICSKLLASLSQAFRLAAVYRATHPMAAEAIRGAFDLLNMAFVTGKRDRISISSAEGRWFCEETLVQSDAQSAEPLQSMFKAQNLRRLSFTRGLRPEELASFCEAASAASGPGGLSSFSESLAQKGMTHIEVELASYSPTADQAQAGPGRSAQEPGTASARPLGADWRPISAPRAGARPSVPGQIPPNRMPLPSTPLAADWHFVPASPISKEDDDDPYPAPASPPPVVEAPEEGMFDKMQAPAEPVAPAAVKRAAPPAPSADETPSETAQGEEDYPYPAPLTQQPPVVEAPEEGMFDNMQPPAEPAAPAPVKRTAPPAPSTKETTSEDSQGEGDYPYPAPASQPPAIEAPNENKFDRMPAPSTEAAPQSTALGGPSAGGTGSGGLGSGEGGTGGTGSSGAGSGGVGSGKSFGTLLRSLVEFAVNDPKQRVQVFEDAARMVKESIEQRVEDATKVISQEKHRAVVQQARTEKVIETVAEGKVIVDEEGKVLMMNPAAEELSGKRLAEVAGKHIMESVTPGESVVAMAKDLSPDAEAVSDVDVAGDQEVGRALRRSMAVVEDASGRVVGTYTALPDVLKYKETLRLQEEFLSRVTHDLQAPLSSINCALELLSERAAMALGPDENGFLDVCLRNSQQLGSMIREILDFSKLRAGKMSIHQAPTSVTGLLKEAVDSLQPWAGNKGVSLSFRAPTPDLMVMADHQRIVQVFTNLISNAIKFTPEGGKIVVAAAPKTDQHGHVVCAVRDTGCGVPKEGLKKLFEKFSQLEDSDGSHPGVGLGLALVSEFIKLHGGTVWVESEVGKGSTFYFTLPSEEGLHGASA